MTEDDRKLVGALHYLDAQDDENLYKGVFGEAAMRVQLLSNEADQLRKALGWFVNDTRFTVQVGGNPLTVPGMIDAATKIYFGEYDD